VAPAFLVETLSVFTVVVEQRSYFGSAGKNPMTAQRAARSMKLEIDCWLGAPTISLGT
jgi:hypothetical protein